MRSLCALLCLAAIPAAAQDQQQARRPDVPHPGAGPVVYDMVAGDRETAWRINRQTGEVVVCRLDTTGSLDTPRARCAPALFDSTMHQPPPVPGSVRP